MKPFRRLVSNLNDVSRYVFFAVLILVCIVALIIGIYAQFFYKYSDSDPLMLGINIASKKTIEEYDLLKSKFDELFNNTLNGSDEDLPVEKINAEKDLIYTAYNLVNEDETYYSVDVKIPEININTTDFKKINSEIRAEYYNKANSIMRQNQGNTVYKVSYAAYINSDILSLVINASLKEQGKSEKVTIKTYNYSISKGDFITLEDLISLKGSTNSTVQSSINSEIERAYQNAQAIANEYGTLYERDLNNRMYEVRNAEEYFLTSDGYVYIIYPYGNNDYTNEMDIVIF